MKHPNRPITFAKSRYLLSYRRLNPTLSEILIDLLDHIPPEYEVILTSLDRTAAEDAALGGSGIHSDASIGWRAVDIAILKDGKGVSNDIYEPIAAAINNRWEYDAKRPNMLCCFAKPHGTGPHFHLQVHLTSRKRPQVV